MQRERRLRKSRDIHQVFREGRVLVHPLVVLRYLPNGLTKSRFGFVAGKGIGNAVVRNRVKRLLREAVRPTPVPEGWDLIFIARRPAAAAGFHQVRASMEILLRRARLGGRGGSGTP